jgi:hypothetical protein
MTRYDFVRHFKTACNTLGVWEYDEPGADVDALDAAAAKVWKLWMFPHLFDGFDPAEWQLSDAERAAVVEQVSRYRTAVEATNDAGAEPTLAELMHARDGLHKLYRVLGPRMFRTENVLVMRDLRRITLTSTDEVVRRWVRGVDIRYRTDFEGDPVIELVVIVPDDALDDEEFWDAWRPARWPLKKRAVERVPGPEYVLMTMVGENELAARMSGVAA